MTDVEALAGLNQNINNLNNVLGASAMQEDAQKFNQQQQEDAQAWQLELWELQNKYNLPTAQIQRFLDAGLNPALVYGRGITSSAAPVPNAPMASSGIGHFPTTQNAVLAAKQAKLIDSQVEVNESVKEKNLADANLSSTRERLEGVYADIAEQNKAILAKFDSLNLLMKQYEAELGYNKTIRDAFYTANYNDVLTLGMEHTRLQNRNLQRDYDRIGAQIALLDSQGKLNEEQAHNLRIQRDILFCERYYAQWNYRMARIINQNVYGSPDSPTASNETVKKVIDTARKEAANALASSTLHEVSLSKDLGFEEEYGDDSRRINLYELPRRQANKVRTDQYVGAVNAVLRLGEAVIESRAPVPLRGPLRQGLRGAFNDFRGSISPDESWNNF